MSIVNDALTKAKKELESKDKVSLNPSELKEGIFPNALISKGVGKKWVALGIISLLVITSLAGYLFLYKKMVRVNIYTNGALNKRRVEIQSTLSQVDLNKAPKNITAEDIAKLDGIMCGSDDKWAIINNEIVKEGDTVLGYEVTSITKESVKIKKQDGQEVLLILKQ